MYRQATVKEVKKSQTRKGIYYLTVEDEFGEIKVLATRKYNIGDRVTIKRKNAKDWIWFIVKEDSPC